MVRLCRNDDDTAAASVERAGDTGTPVENGELVDDNAYWRKNSFGDALKAYEPTGSRGDRPGARIQRKIALRVKRALTLRWVGRGDSNNNETSHGCTAAYGGFAWRWTGGPKTIRKTLGRPSLGAITRTGDEQNKKTSRGVGGTGGRTRNA